MCNRSMSLSGLHLPFALPIALSFAPCSSPPTSKRIKIDPSQAEKHSPAVSDREEIEPGRAEEQENEKRYCCAYHMEMFAQEFDSEDEEKPKRVCRKYEKTTFLLEIPFDVKHYLVSKRNFRDSGTQHEEPGPSLAVLANYTVGSDDGSACFSIPAQIYTGPYHLPEYIQPKIGHTAFQGLFPDVPLGGNTVECPLCSQRFSTGQALGGHVSRRHSAKHRKGLPIILRGRV